VATVALADVHFSIGAGEIVAYLGKNGAGKSTTVKCLTGIIRPDAGVAEVAGFVPWQRRRDFFRQIGVLFGQRSQLIWDLPVRDSFELLAAQYAVSRAQYLRRLNELNELFDLRAIMANPARTLSLGQRVLADLCAVLLHSPKVLFLDEPTIGLDVVTKHNVRQLLRHLAQSGMTIFLTTHDVADLERLAHRVILLDEGTVRFDGSISHFRERFSSGMQVVITFSEPVVLPEPLTATATTEDGLTYIFRVSSSREVPDLVRRVASLPTPMIAMQAMPESTEDLLRKWLSPGDSEPRRIR
jgi:ABC-2 type transport system ATP-binding protein